MKICIKKVAQIKSRESHVINEHAVNTSCEYTYCPFSRRAPKVFAKTWTS
jgi:hypothetical protein